MISALKSFSRRFKFLMAGCVCALLFFVNALPAAAVDSYNSSPTEGETQLNETIRKTEEVSRSNPRSLGELQRTQQGEGGLNAVQGKADAQKMSRPENSPEAKSVETKIKEGLKGILD